MRPDDSDIPWVRSKFLAGLSDAAVRHLLDAAHLRHIEPHKAIIAQGERPNHMFLLKKGQTRSYISTEGGVEIALLWATPGEVLGLVSLLPSPKLYGEHDDGHRL